MKILLASYSFFPSVGGVEEVNASLARAFVERGHAVKVITMTPSTERESLGLEIIRAPGARALIEAIRWCDVFLQANVSFRLGWPNFLIRRPWIIVLHGNIGDEWPARGFAKWKARLKRASLAMSDMTIACSNAVARKVTPAAIVLPNPYRDHLFRRLSGAERKWDLVYLGRLVSDKGVSLLIDAVAALRTGGINASLLIIGGGPEEAALRALCDSRGIAGQVAFAGVQRGEPLVRLLNSCKAMVIPSVVEEGFPTVALEGIACGCAIVAADIGGLPEAVGPCGVTFAKGDVQALAETLRGLLLDSAKIEKLIGQAENHLRDHRAAAAAEKYLTVLTAAARH